MSVRLRLKYKLTYTYAAAGFETSFTGAVIAAILIVTHTIIRVTVVKRRRRTFIDIWEESHTFTNIINTLDRYVMGIYNNNQATYRLMIM